MSDVKARGDVSFNPQLKLRDCWLVESFNVNLISVGQLADRDMNLEFNKHGAIIRNKQGRVILRAKRTKKLYEVEEFKDSARVLNSVNPAPPLDHFHRVFGHPSTEKLKQLLKKLKIVPSTNELQFCHACATGKLDERRFKRRSEHAKTFLYRLHFDTAGPLPSSVRGHKYFVVVIDEATRFVVRIEILKSRKETSDKITALLKELDNHESLKVGVLRSDGAREFVTTDLNKTCMELGIRREINPRYVHGTNGMVERVIRSLKDKIRVLLCHARLSSRLWIFALKYGRELYNRTPQQRLKWMAPIELKTGSQLRDMQTMYTFGSVCYCKTPTELRRGLDDKGEKALYLGTLDGKKMVYLLKSKTYGFPARTVKVADGELMDEETLRLHGLFKGQEEHYSLGDVMDEEHKAPPDAPAPVQYREQHQEKWRKRLRKVARKSYEETPDELDRILYAPDAVEELLYRSNVDTEELTDHYAENMASGFPNAPWEVIQTFSENAKDAAVVLAVQSVLQEGSDRTVEEAPKSYDKACRKACWRDAMDREMENMRRNNVFTLVDPPSRSRILRPNWVFKVNHDVGKGGSLYKARITADGSRATALDYGETYAPVGRLLSLRLVLIVSKLRNYDLVHWDVSAAFLNASLEEDTFMFQPPGYHDGSSRVWKLNRALYGLCQSPRAWYQELTTTFKALRLRQSNIDPCLFFGTDIIVFVYVDDFLVTGSASNIARLHKSIFATYKMKDCGYPTRFLGLEFINDSDGVWLTCRTHIQNALSEFKLTQANPVRTPLDPGAVSLRPWDGHTSPQERREYQRLIGTLLYISTILRFDISYAVNFLSQFSSNPGSNHMKAARRILRYLKGTMNMGVLLANDVSAHTLSDIRCHIRGEEGLSPPTKLMGFSDSDYAACYTRRSRTGYIFMWCGIPITWQSRKQSVVSLSTCEAELYALVDGGKEGLFINKLAWELMHQRIYKDYIELPTLPMFSDNQATLKVAKNKGSKAKRMKHVDTRYAWINERVEEKSMKVAYVPTKENIADLFTKPVDKETLKKLRNLGGLKMIEVLERSFRGSVERQPRTQHEGAPDRAVIMYADWENPHCDLD